MRNAGLAPLESLRPFQAPLEADFVVVGCGIAGMRAAIELAAAGRVVVLTKSRPDESSTEYAQGGIAAALSDDDDIRLHREDTLAAGDGLCNEEAVRILVREGKERVGELIDWGMEFDQIEGELAFTREAAHSRNRVLHAQGDSTGRAISRVLHRCLNQCPQLQLVPFTFATRLTVEEGVCTGLAFLDERSGKIGRIVCPRVLLATGGAGMVFLETTNPSIATGDGLALAFRAGAAVADMEFVQFHPTVLSVPGAPRFLLSEALRGEGAWLKNGRGERFMLRYHPAAELAPRDVVSRAIVAETEAGHDGKIHLDLRHLKAEYIRLRFPRIYSTCLQFGINLTTQPVPVFPAAHYLMGGVWTDLSGCTTLPGLFAAGEVACNGVHGANRLASNSLLEGLVFGYRAAQAMRGGRPAGLPESHRHLLDMTWDRPLDEGNPGPGPDEVREVMSRGSGILRSGESLQKALGQLLEWPQAAGRTRRELETGNLLVAARLITCSALARTESRGAHFRTDYPGRHDLEWRCRLAMRFEPDENRVILDRIGLQGGNLA